MATILHVIEALSLGGAGRAVIALGKYSSQTAGHRHQILPLSLEYSDPNAVALAQSEGVEVIAAESEAQQAQAIEQADIVQVNWWNTPLMQQFCYRALPPARLVSWCHVAGDRIPQVVTPMLVDYFDFTVACSPYTYESEAIQSLPTERRLAATGMAYGATDFARLANFKPRAHSGFRIGYVGTINFVKMHRNYVAMSARVNIPDVRFVVCGTGGQEGVLRDDAQRLGVAARFEIKGYVGDIVSELETFDLYGYPLCEDTYAAAELNLQEVMYCGICPVAFPYGGIRMLVMNDYTGVIVKSELEYAQAIEYLYHNPAERVRLAKNAKEYAAQIFGAENAAKKFNEYYAQCTNVTKTISSLGL